jgi:hypothetical protein
MISTSGIGGAGELHAKNQQQVPHRAFSPVRNDKVSWGAHNCAQQYGLPLGIKRHFRRTLFRAARTEDKKLRKDLTYLEVLALKVPFGRLFVLKQLSE